MPAHLWLLLLTLTHGQCSPLEPHPLLDLYSSWGSILEESTVQDASRLFSEFWSWRLARSPEFASLAGHGKEHNGELEEYTEERFGEDLQTCREFYGRAEGLLAGTGEGERDDLEYFMAELQTFIDCFQYGGFYFPINFRNGLHLDFQKLAGWVAVSTLTDYQDLLARYNQFPTYVEQVIGVMRAGIAKNMTNHAVSMEGVLDQIQAHLEGEVQTSVFYQPFLVLENNQDLTEATKDDLKLQASTTIAAAMRPALQNLSQFLLTEYLPACRPQIGASSLPGGQFYNACIRYHTSTNMTADEIHRLGKQEVDRIEMEMEEVVKELGLNVTLKQFTADLRADPDNFFGSKQQVFDAFNSMITDKVMPQLPNLFKKMPRTKLELVEQPNPEASKASYIAGTEDGSRPGQFFLNTHNYASFSRHGVATLSLHETLPGHHLQGDHMMREGVPAFRKVMEDRIYSQAPSRFPINTAYIEGWALYSESLGYELGLYQDPMARFGALDAMIFRACRLVVDTGIHALGWTREQAVQYMLSHTSRSRGNVEREIKRYITWPGQALGYKVGQLKLQQLRQLAEEQLGDSFDIKDFHEVVLNAAGPLHMVEKRVRRYIKETIA